MSQMDAKAPQPGPNMGMNVNNLAMVGAQAGMEQGAQQRGGGGQEKQTLNTYIYDYFLRNDMLECAKALLKSPGSEVQTDGNFRQSPSGRPKNEGEMNGVDDDAMDSSDGPQGIDNAKTVQDLPQAKVPTNTQGSFLFDWWCCFMDIYFARSKAGNPSQAASAYVNNNQRVRNDMLRFPTGQALMGAGQMNMPGFPGRMMQTGMMPNGGGIHVGQEGVSGPGDMAHKPGAPLAQRALKNNLVQRAPHQMGINQRPQILQQMREGEGGDMAGGQGRPQSPATSAASPGNKRVRLENGQYEQVGGGRGAPQGVPPGNPAQFASATHQVLLANGINPQSLTPGQFAQLQGQLPTSQARSLQIYAQSIATATGKNIAHLQGAGPKAVPQNPGQAGSPMMPQVTDGSLGAGMGEFYSQGIRNPGGTGNHALQDYQMQLMLLEQQNKKRLLMARAEQDSISNSDANRPGYPQGMSPGSRAAPSPGPSGKPGMGTPKIPNQVGPGSPMPDGQMGHPQQRSSPAAGGFNGQIPDGQHQMMFNPMDKMGMTVPNAGGGVPNGMIRPSFSGPMGPEMGGQMNPNMARAAQAGRGQPAGNVWQQHPQQGSMQQMPQQPQVQQGATPQAQQPGGPQNQPPQQAGTPQPGRQTLNHAMPPPQAPPSGPGQQRQTPASPQVQNNPQTPTPNNKAAAKKSAKPVAKGKKGAQSTNTAATPTATSEPPTPTTPHPPSNSFTQGRPPNFTSGNNQGNNAQAGQAPQPPTNNGPAPTAAGVGDEHPFMDIGMDFAATFEGGPTDGLLDNFDFDSFLNTEENGNMANFGGDMPWTEVESGPGEA